MRTFPNVYLHLQAHSMKRALSEIHLLAPQKCGHFFNYFLFTLARVSRRVPYKFSKLSARVRRRALSKGIRSLFQISYSKTSFKFL